mmetsp:Transcript_10517/g.19679  ORF Transcript_10517/g.19679 Transcript_10517/m.19679 type:complete len:258 (-) Transcript_10517:209-982(-)
MDQKLRDRDHQDRHHQQTSHHGREGKTPVKGSQVLLAIHEETQEDGSPLTASQEHHGHLGLYVTSALRRLHHRILQQKALSGDCAKNHAKVHEDERVDKPAFGFVSFRIARRDEIVVTSILELAVVGGWQRLEAQDQQRHNAHAPSQGHVGLPVRAQDWKTVSDQAEWKKQHFWKLHQGLDGRQDIWLQAQVAQKEAIADAHAKPLSEGQAKTVQRHTDRLPCPNAQRLDELGAAFSSPFYVTLDGHIWEGEVRISD